MTIELIAKMKVNIQISYDNCNPQNVSINKRRIINIPNNVNEIKIFTEPEKKVSNIFYYFFISVFLFFLETQKTYEKRDFVSFYDFSRNINIINIKFKIQQSTNNKKCVVKMEEKSIGKETNILYWTPVGYQEVEYSYDYSLLKHYLLQLIGFWTCALILPFVFVVVVSIISYIKTKIFSSIFIFLILFILLTFIVQSIYFCFQYKKKKEAVTSLTQSLNYKVIRE